MTSRRFPTPWHADPKHGKFTNARVLNHIHGQLLASGQPRGYVGSLKFNRKLEYRGRVVKASELAASITPAQRQAADASKAVYQKALAAKGLGAVTTEIAPSGEFYFAEDYHQQYLAKNPAGYCGLGGTGVSCPIGAGVTAA